MKVFISGSISIKSLDEDELGALEQVIEGNRAILIGDAYGVDKAVQQILANRLRYIFRAKSRETISVIGRQSKFPIPKICQAEAVIN
jgi:hypothetical protein